MGDSLGPALVLALLFASLRSLSGTYPPDLGVSLSRWPANLLLGYVAFVLATRPLLTLNGVLSLLSYVREHQYEELGQAGMRLDEWCLMFFAATVAAPITEELLFRGLIQGWLRRASLAGHVAIIIVMVLISVGYSIEFKEPVGQARDADGQRPRVSLEDLADNIQSIHWSRIGVTIGLSLLYLAFLRRLRQDKLFMTEADFRPPQPVPESETLETEAEQDEAAPAERSESTRISAERQSLAVDHLSLSPETQTTSGKPQWGWPARIANGEWRKSGLAIFGSAVMFGLVHQTWPGPIPLILLGLVLG